VDSDLHTPPAWPAQVVSAAQRYDEYVWTPFWTSALFDSHFFNFNFHDLKLKIQIIVLSAGFNFN